MFSFIKTGFGTRESQRGFAAATVLSGILLAGLAAGVMYSGWSSTQRTTASLTKSSNNDSLMSQVRAAIISEHADLDGDGTPEGPAPLTGVTPIPTGGGQIPASSKAPKTDGWGTAFGYCAFKNGSGADRAGYIRNTATSTGGEISFAIISAGSDKTIQTTCAQALTQSAQGDDKLATYSLADVTLSGVTFSGAGSGTNSTDVQNKQVACVASGKLYAGVGATGADANGCIAPAGSGGGIVTDAQGRLAVSCTHISQLVTNPSDGEYMLLGVPTDGSLPAMYPTECDFTTWGGKWTMVAKYDPTAACPATMKAGGVCSAPSDGIDLMNMSRISNDMTSVRALTNALRYLKPFSEIMMKDANGSFIVWNCGGNQSRSWYERYLVYGGAETCSISSSTFHNGGTKSLNTLTPRFQVNLTGFRELTSTPFSWWSCPAYSNCDGDWTIRTTVQRDYPGYSGNYYFNAGYVYMPARGTNGVADWYLKVCDLSTLETRDVVSPIGGTYANGCQASWISTFRGPWSFTSGPRHDWSYAVDYPGDENNILPSLAHLATQPRPNQNWAPDYQLTIVSPAAINGTGWHQRLNFSAPNPSDSNNVCNFGYGQYDAYWGNGAAAAGVFFRPTSYLVYGNGTLSSVQMGYAGPWQDAYAYWEFTGGTGQNFAIPGYVDLKYSMINGSGNGRSICAGTRKLYWGYLHQDGYCVFQQYKDFHASGYWMWQDGCQAQQAFNKTETAFNALPGSVPLGFVKSFMPTDIRKIYIR